MYIMLAVPVRKTDHEAIFLDTKSAVNVKLSMTVIRLVLCTFKVTVASTVHFYGYFSANYSANLYA